MTESFWQSMKTFAQHPLPNGSEEASEEDAFRALIRSESVIFLHQVANFLALAKNTFHDSSHALFSALFIAAILGIGHYIDAKRSSTFQTLSCSHAVMQICVGRTHLLLHDQAFVMSIIIYYMSAYPISVRASTT